MSREHNAEHNTDKPKLNLEEAVRNALKGLRYGSVEIAVPQRPRRAARAQGTFPPGRRGV